MLIAQQNLCVSTAELQALLCITGKFLKLRPSGPGLLMMPAAIARIVTFEIWRGPPGRNY